MFQNGQLLLVFLLVGVSAASLYSFTQCERDVKSILNGTLTLGDVSNETIGRYIWHGPVTGLNVDYPRDQYLALTYEGRSIIMPSVEPRD
jgi:hypothetical protein